MDLTLEEYKTLYPEIYDNLMVFPDIKPSGTFYDRRYRFYCFDLHKNQTKIKFSYDIKYDNEWIYEESRYLTNLIDSLILNTVMTYNKQVHLNINYINKLGDLEISDNPNLDNILTEVTDHYDTRGFYNILDTINMFNIVRNIKMDCKILSISLYLNNQDTVNPKQVIKPLDKEYIYNIQPTFYVELTDIEFYSKDNPPPNISLEEYYLKNGLDLDINLDLDNTKKYSKYFEKYNKLKNLNSLMKAGDIIYISPKYCSIHSSFNSSITEIYLYAQQEYVTSTWNLYCFDTLIYSVTIDKNYKPPFINEREILDCV